MNLLKYVAALILFGSNGVVASRIAMGSHEIVFMRTIIGSLFLVAVWIASRATPRFHTDKRQFAFLVGSGMAMGTSWLFLFEAYRHVGVSVATLAYYCGPAMVIALAPIVFKEALRPSSVIGFLVVFLGMICVNGRALVSGGVSTGLVFGVLSACMYAAMVVLNKKANRITGLENPVWQLIAAGLTVAAFVGIKQGFGIRVPTDSWAAVLVLGLVNTGLGCYLYFSSIGAIPAQSVAILGYLEPLSALLFAATVLGEVLTAAQVLGAVLILGGAASSELLRMRGSAGAHGVGVRLTQ